MDDPSQSRKSYYETNKQHLNYNRKLLYNKNKHAFLDTKDDAEKWIKYRKFILPFSKVLQETHEIDEVLSLLNKYLIHQKEK
tara:strand:+ start:189 stop:434 length:246 start_codon:yes stop_codon:yes gene_type:complete